MEAEVRDLDPGELRRLDQVDSGRDFYGTAVEDDGERLLFRGGRR
jgi:hypothetical protein